MNHYRFSFIKELFTTEFLKKINRSLTPTVIVFVGIFEKNIDKYNNNCIFPINFGRVYNMEKPEKVL